MSDQREKEHDISPACSQPELRKKLKHRIKQQVKEFNANQNEFIMEQYGTSVNIRDTDENQCAGITVKSKDGLYLENLYKCGKYSGTNVILAVEKFGRNYGYKTIQLEDESVVEYKIGEDIFSISVPILQILATGMTWYNKLEYRSIHFEKEFAHNKQVIELPFITFVRRIAQKAEYSPKKIMYLVGGLSSIFDDGTLDVRIKVKKVFQAVSARLKTTQLVCDRDFLQWVVKVLNFIEIQGDAVQTKIKNANEDNIIYLKSFPQIKIL